MKKLIAICALLALSSGALAKDLPYNEKADASAEVSQALTQAQKTGKPVLVIFGANWCEDCRSLGRSLATQKNAALMKSRFEVVKVDVGNFDHNTDIAGRYGNPIQKGIPAAVIVSPQDKVLFTTKAGELANARHMSDQGVYDFFVKALDAKG